MDTAELVLNVVSRVGKLLDIGIRAAMAGDKKSVDEILPDPDDYPDEHAYQRIKKAADKDYGPSPE